MGAFILKGLILSVLSLTAVMILKTGAPVHSVPSQNQVTETKTKDEKKIDRPSAAIRRPASINYVEKRPEPSEFVKTKHIEEVTAEEKKAEPETINTQVAAEAYPDHIREGYDENYVDSSETKREIASKKSETQASTLSGSMRISNVGPGPYAAAPVARATSPTSATSSSSSSSISFPTPTGNYSIAHIGIENENIVITGTNLDQITDLNINGNSISAHLTALSNNSSQLVARSLSGLSLAMGLIYNLVISDAHGAATYPVEVTLADGSVELKKLEAQTAGEDGWTIVWDNSAGEWVASDTALDITKDIIVRSIGVNYSTPTRALEVNGVIAPIDGGSRSYNAGISTEAGSSLINFGINDSNSNRFGGTYNSGAQGGFLRMDARSGPNLFGFFGRAAGSTGTVTEMVSIAATGFVGINKTNPGFHLDIGGTNPTIRLYGDAASYYPAISFYGNNGTYTGNISGYTGTGMLWESGGAHYWRTNGVGTMSLDGSGNVIALGSVTATSFPVSSDLRLKQNVKPLTNSLQNVDQLRGVSFEWKKTKKKEIGFIAQEVEKVYPELVETNKETGMKGVKYSNMVAILLEAIKDLYRQVTADNKELERIKAENKAMKEYLCQKDKKAPFCKN